MQNTKTYSPQLITLAKRLRRTATPGEKKLWRLFQELRLSHGIRVRRQQPIGPYIADFYCAKFKCVIEIDGLSHDAKAERDAERDAYMKSQGLSVLRFVESDAQYNPKAILDSFLANFDIDPKHD